MPEQSIFGNTMRGVPNPLVTHYHPYPTRYHGPRWQDVRAGGQYRVGSWSVGNRTLQTLGGLGAYSPAQSSLADAVFGGIASGVVAYHAPKSGRGALADILLWTMAGAIGGALLGTIGVGLACAGASVSASVERKLATR